MQYGMHLIADINYEHVKLCFVLVPLRGKIIMDKSRTWYLLGVSFEHPFTFMWDSLQEGRS